MAQLHAKWIRRLFLNTLTYIQRKKKATTNLQDRVFKITIVKLMSKQSNWSFQNKLAFDCLKEGKVDINLNKSIIICTDANILPMINPNRLLNWKSPLLKKKSKVHRSRWVELHSFHAREENDKQRHLNLIAVIREIHFMEYLSSLVLKRKTWTEVTRMQMIHHWISESLVQCYIYNNNFCRFDVG